ncbi:MAG: hypothetical protein Q4D62_06620 [Planctomycetia bacterium]|nr:hypothetical protein [Planctomycetia bacterium]
MFYAWFAMGVIACTFFWNEFLPKGSQTTLLLIFFLAWILGIFLSQQHEVAVEAREAQSQKNAMAEDTLFLAQTAYLRQDFYETERVLRERLSKVPEDIPARMLFVGMLRRLQRWDEVRQQLALLEQNPQLGGWYFEVWREKERTNRAEKESIL